jgi:two-component system response regulator YesN
MERQRILVAADEMPSGVWKAFQDQAEVTFVRDGQEAKRILSTQTFQVVFLDIFLTGIDGLQLLRFLQQQGAQSAVILTSEAPNFQFARQGLLYGACDYLLRPLCKEVIAEALERIQRRQTAEDTVVAGLLPGLTKALRQENFVQEMGEAFDAITRQDGDPLSAANRCRNLYQRLVQDTFQSCPWLELYLSPQECNDIQELRTSDALLVQTTCLAQGQRLNSTLLRLYPATEEGFGEILIYMLEHVEQLESQKELAQRFFMSASTLSERFSANLHSSYREYHQTLRLYRAAYLMRNTSLKLYEICARLGFRDVSYFSRQFRLQTGATVADYRQEGGWDFQI